MHFQRFKREGGNLDVMVSEDYRNTYLWVQSYTTVRDKVVWQLKSNVLHLEPFFSEAWNLVTKVRLEGLQGSAIFLPASPTSRLKN